MDLIDIRSKQKFAAMHIPGARSVPLAKLAEARMLRPVRAMTDRVYVISDDRSRASLACGILRASGRVDPVIVDGGMQAWIAQGFPVRTKFSLNFAHLMIASAILLGVAAGMALALREIAIAALILVSAGVLILKARSFAQTPALGTVVDLRTACST